MQGTKDREREMGGGDLGMSQTHDAKYHTKASTRAART